VIATAEKASTALYRHDDSTWAAASPGRRVCTQQQQYLQIPAFQKSHSALLLLSSSPGGLHMPIVSFSMVSQSAGGCKKDTVGFAKIAKEIFRTILSAPNPRCPMLLHFLHLQSFPWPSASIDGKLRFYHDPQMFHPLPILTFLKNRQPTPRPLHLASRRDAWQDEPMPIARRRSRQIDMSKAGDASPRGVWRHARCGARHSACPKV
jgi:hypothetical protein